MNLYIIRHAEAEDPSQSVDDADRQLTDAGARDFEAVAQTLARIVNDVDRLLVSPLLRARQTADILRKETGWPDFEVFDPLRPGTLVTDIASAIPNVKSTALIGHEPQMSGLAAYLLGAVNIKLKAGAVIHLTADSLQPGAATLRWILTPELVRGSD